MLHLLKCRFIQLLRDRTDMFWALLFPVILATLMNFAFSNIWSDESLDPIPVAVVTTEENERSDSFIQFTEEMDSILKVSFLKEEKALERLEEKEVEGIFYTGDKNSLTVSSSNLNTSILESLLSSYNKNEAMILEIAATHPERLEEALNALADYESRTEAVTVAGETLDPSITYFFAVIAMACLYGCFLGIRCPLEMQPNQSALGARRSITPTHRLKLVIADMTATFVLHFANVVILLLYMKYILRISFGDKMAGMLAVCFFGSLIGIALGVFIGSIGKLKEGAKIGIMLGVSMVCSFFSGLMAHNIKNIVEKNIPILNRINPAALISDALYCLNVYNDTSRFYLSIGILAVMSIVLTGVGFLMVRRERYDSI